VLHFYLFIATYPPNPYPLGTTNLFFVSIIFIAKMLHKWDYTLFDLIFFEVYQGFILVSQDEVGKNRKGEEKHLQFTFRR
jgi:hypothetical protein